MAFHIFVRSDKVNGKPKIYFIRESGLAISSYFGYFYVNTVTNGSMSSSPSPDWIQIMIIYIYIYIVL